MEVFGKYDIRLIPLGKKEYVVQKHRVFFLQCFYALLDSLDVGQDSDTPFLQILQK